MRSRHARRVTPGLPWPGPTLRGGLFAVVFGALTTACSGGSGVPQTAGSPAGAQKIDPATAASVTGVVTIDGAAPENAPIRMNADPMCLRIAKGEQFQETFKVGGDGKALGNVFVWVKDGLGNYVYDPPTGPVTLTQESCHYAPHVFGIRVGQPLEVVNNDETLHNIHATPRTNQEFNKGQPMKGMKDTHTFTTPEVLVPFKCDVHGWMNAFVGVVDHPFFAVTDAEGKFELKGLPPGTYTVEAIHERLGAVTQSVTVAAKESKSISFAIRADRANPTA
ncbi:MAG: hypothetical protein FJW27_08645 [Acidimicrobiia bacterium]|nr:hypothetical protein [Acidimicrobiia bacterium]